MAAIYLDQLLPVGSPAPISNQQANLYFGSSNCKSEEQA